MNELQLGLVVLGGVAVLGVFGYNKWQERQHRKVAERVFQHTEEDVLLERRPVEPVWHEGDAPAGAERREPAINRIPSEDDEWARHEAEQAEMARQEAEAARAAARELAEEEEITPAQVSAPEPLLEEAVSVPDEAPVSPPWEVPSEAPTPDLLPEKASVAEAATLKDVPLPASLLCEGVDAIAVLELVEKVPAPQLLASQADALKRLKKPVLWVGFNETSEEWECLDRDTQTAYRRLRVGLQLADRQGPAGGGDVSLFATLMQQLADELMAVVDMPSSQQALDQARQLDAFCADVDMQIGVNLVSKGTPFAGTKIRALAESAGMTLGLDGVYVRCDDDGRVLFSLQNFESVGFAADTLKQMSTHGLIFLLDVPRTPRGQHVYTQMVEIAKRFAEALGGSLVDDNRQPLGDTQLTHIRQEYVIKPQALMESHGLPAGSALSLRLFN